MSPLLPRRRRGLAVAPAAPLLALLLVAVIFFRAPLTTTVSSPDRVDPTLVAGAREKGAVCLDGSPPGHHLRRGSGSGAHNWLIYLEVTECSFLIANCCCYHESITCISEAPTQMGVPCSVLLKSVEKFLFLDQKVAEN